MKKIRLLFLSFLLVFSLSACVVDNDYVGDKDDNIVDDDIIDDEPTVVPAEILTLIEEDVSMSLTFTEMSEEVAGTSIVNVYVGKDDSEMAKVYVLRMVFMGRWDDVDFMVLFDVENDEVISVIIVEENENWGSFVTLDSFLDQFMGKSIDFYLTNDVLLGVDGNSSATTTIGGINNSLEEAINHYKNNLE